MVQVYNYMTESLPVKKDGKYPVSRRSDNRKVYDRIVNLSKSMPVYKINLTKENREYTIGIKETALELKRAINNMADPEVSGFNSKSITISNEKVLSAEFMNGNTDDLPDNIQFNIKSLASVQINKGRELLKTSRALHTGEYKFKARVDEDIYKLIYVQKDRTENNETLLNVAEYLNNSVPGINALVEKGSSKDYTRLTILSDISGRYGEKKFMFEDMDDYEQGIVDFIGMNRTDKASAPAEFDLNGVAKQTATNIFTLDNALRISIHERSDQPVNLRIVPDSEKILDSVDTVLTVFNKIVKLAKDRTLDSKEHYKAEKLINEMKSLENVYNEELSACGISASEDGRLHMEDSLAVQAAQDGGMESLFTRENGFMARLLDKTESIAINPIEYLDKTIVTYPDNEKKLFRNPYMTSIYTGLFFNSYC